MSSWWCQDNDCSRISISNRWNSNCKTKTMCSKFQSHVICCHVMGHINACLLLVLHTKPHPFILRRSLSLTGWVVVDCCCVSSSPPPTFWGPRRSKVSTAPEWARTSEVEQLKGNGKPDSHTIVKDMFERSIVLGENKKRFCHNTWEQKHVRSFDLREKDVRLPGPSANFLNETANPKSSFRHQFGLVLIGQLVNCPPPCLSEADVLLIGPSALGGSAAEIGQFAFRTYLWITISWSEIKTTSRRCQNASESPKVTPDLSLWLNPILGGQQERLRRIMFFPFPERNQKGNRCCLLWSGVHFLKCVKEILLLVKTCEAGWSLLRETPTHGSWNRKTCLKSGPESKAHFRVHLDRWLAQE